MSDVAKPCPFCGGKVDPEGWAQESGFPDPPGVIERGPECEDCGATARTMEAWNRRAGDK
jgi:hypothetical protein